MIRLPVPAGRLDECRDQRQRHIDHKRIYGQKHGIEKTGRQDLRDRPRTGERIAEITPQYTGEPMKISNNCGIVEVKLLPEERERFGRCVASENARGNIARQDFDDRKDDD